MNPYRAFGARGYERGAAMRLYVRARHLRVDLGRWVSKDSGTIDAAVADPYSYVLNRPTVEADPRGLGPAESRCPSAVPNDDPKSPPPGMEEKCTKCGGKLVYVTCYDDGSCQNLRNGKKNSNLAAVYCRDDQWLVTPSGKMCHPNEACNDYDKGRMDKPVFNDPSDVCIWGSERHAGLAYR